MSRWVTTSEVILPKKHRSNPKLDKIPDPLVGLDIVQQTISSPTLLTTSRLISISLRRYADRLQSGTL